VLFSVDLAVLYAVVVDCEVVVLTRKLVSKAVDVAMFVAKLVTFAVAELD
jgi:hypothetical protein